MSNLANILTNEEAKIKGYKTQGDISQVKVLASITSAPEGWTETISAMQFPHGCLIMVSKEQKHTSRDIQRSDAAEFVSGVSLDVDAVGNNILVRSGQKSVAKPAKSTEFEIKPAPSKRAKK